MVVSKSKVQIGELLERTQRLVDVDPIQTYRMVGVRSFGGGCFDAGELAGGSTRYSQFIQVNSGDFVYPKLMAWEGAFAVVPDEFDGFFASTEFCTFRLRPDRVDGSFMRHFFRWPETWQHVASASIGTNLRRRRLYPEVFLERELSVPPLEEQRRIGAKLDLLTARTVALNQEYEKAEELGPLVADGAVQQVLDAGLAAGWPSPPLADIAVINPRPQRLPEGEVVSFVPMAAVDEVAGSIVSPEERLAGELRGRYRQFRNGDVIFARITPCMQNGKAAVADLSTTYAFGSTEFHVIRPHNQHLAAWIHRIVRTRRFRIEAAERFTGTAGQQRVPADFLREVRIPTPPPDELNSALATIDAILKRQLEIRKNRILQKERLSALELSILNHAFNGRRTDSE